MSEGNHHSGGSLKINLQLSDYPRYLKRITNDIFNEFIWMEQTRCRSRAHYLFQCLKTFLVPGVFINTFCHWMLLMVFIMFSLIYRFFILILSGPFPEMTLCDWPGFASVLILEIKISHLLDLLFVPSSASLWYHWGKWWPDWWCMDRK